MKRVALSLIVFLWEKALGAEHPHVATSLNNLAWLYQAQGQYAEAEPLCERALAILEKALGAEHPDVALSLNNLAALYRLQGRYAEAEPLFKRSLAIWEKALGAEHLDVAESLNNLALLYQAQGRYAEAEPLYKRSLAIREKALGAEHPDVAQSFNNLARLYKAQGKYAEAEPLHKRALAIREKALGAGYPHVPTMTEKFWIDPIERHCADLLFAVMRELAGDGEMSFEGEIRDTGLELLPGASFKKTDALQWRIRRFLRCESPSGASFKKTDALRRQIRFPRADFLVLPLTDHNVAAICKVITEKDLLSGYIPHVQIAWSGRLIFGAYDYFDEECVVAYEGFPVALLDRLVANSVIRSYQTVSGDAHRWHD